MTQCPLRTLTTNIRVAKDRMDGKSDHELWALVQAFFVGKKDRNSICRVIHKEGLGGRSSSENRDVCSTYYREYYWSEVYKKEVEETGLTERDYEVGRRTTNINVQPAYLLYSISEYADVSLTKSQEIAMPSPHLFNALGLRSSVSDGVWLTKDGHVVCFDSRWMYGSKECLLIRENLLLGYMKHSGKSIVWPVLMERTIKHTSTAWPRIQAGGYVWRTRKDAIIRRCARMKKRGETGGKNSYSSR